MAAIEAAREYGQEQLESGRLMCRADETDQYGTVCCVNRSAVAPNKPSVQCSQQRYPAVVPYKRQG